ncbi:ribosomal protein S18-alanine N-acetyltransferase [Alkaliphilus crotonatoxidans]
MIRPMELRDIKQVADIENRSFPVPWSRGAFEKEIKKNRLAKYIVLERENQLLAFGGMWLIIDEAHVTNIAVDPNYRGLGLGRQLVQGMIQGARELGMLRMTLEVRRSNLVAQNLYQSLGFACCGVRPGYYEDNGEDALIMWKELTE